MGVASCIIYLLYSFVLLSVSYLDCVVACDAGIIDSADFEHGSCGSACCAVWEKLDCTEGSDETVWL